MKHIVTKQGKTFYYRDVLLFNVVNDNIVLIVDDTEQLDKYSLTKNSKDAPIAVIPYSEETLKEIIAGMKKIDTYTKLNENKILVEFSHPQLGYPTKVAFDGSNKEIIENNLIEQRKISDNNSVGNWYEGDENVAPHINELEEGRRFKVKQIEKYNDKIDELEQKRIISLICLGIFAILCALGIYKTDFDSYKELAGFMYSMGVSASLPLYQLSRLIAKKASYEVLKDELEEELGDELEEEKSRGAK